MEKRDERVNLVTDEVPFRDEASQELRGDRCEIRTVFGSFCFSRDELGTGNGDDVIAAIMEMLQLALL